jgi:hypothetical protein
MSYMTYGSRIFVGSLQRKKLFPHFFIFVDAEIRRQFDNETMNSPRPVVLSTEADHHCKRQHVRVIYLEKKRLVIRRIYFTRRMRGLLVSIVCSASALWSVHQGEKCLSAVASFSLFRSGCRSSLRRCWTTIEPPTSISRLCMQKRGHRVSEVHTANRTDGTRVLLPLLRHLDGQEPNSFIQADVFGSEVERQSCTTQIFSRKQDRPPALRNPLQIDSPLQVMPRKSELLNSKSTVDPVPDSASACVCPPAARRAWPIVESTPTPVAGSRVATVFNRSTSNTEISPYYRRDSRDIEMFRELSPGNADAIAELLRQRYEARLRQRRSNRTDSTAGKKVAETAFWDDLLRVNHQVRVYEQPPLWTRHPDDPIPYQRRLQRRWQDHLVERYGPLGHPYQRAQLLPPGNIEASNSNLTAKEFHALLSRLHQFRSIGNQRLVRRIRLVLQEQGYSLFESDADNCYLWTSGSQCDLGNYTSSFSVAGPREAERLEWFEPDRYYKHCEFVRPPSSNPLRIRQRVLQLMMKFTSAKAVEDFAEALFLEYELFRTYHVGIVHERRRWFLVRQSPKGSKSQRLWSVPALDKILNTTGILSEHNTFGNAASQRVNSLVVELDGMDLLQTGTPEYSCSPLSRPIANRLLARRIQHLVHERTRRREEGMFLEADSIRSELWYSYVSDQRIGERSACSPPNVCSSVVCRIE